MIKLQNVSKSFGKLNAVDQISFEVQQEENLILLGTSGCGKTTTLKMINRLLKPSSGKILINGQDIRDQSPEVLRRKIGYVLQNNGLFPHYTVAQNIGLVPQLLKWDKQRIAKRVIELLEKLHLSEKYLQAYPNELSGGQQQRVGLARALAADPPILLMDEPFGALDNVTRAKIHTEFTALDELKRKTIVMVTHDVQEAFQLGDRICLMDKGKIMQMGTPAELLFKPVHHFVEDFLKEQRLQLEFKAVRLYDLWDWIPTEADPPEEVALSVDTDLWTGLETFTCNHTEKLTILHPQKKEFKVVGFEQLMSAFYQYKKTIAA
ncbi:ABC transporter ATP-binding protein [Olivibacter ginsenosidimutans]|uniref:ABC transporter ATP-binding protein n=1 Tax=Olivibacter ginsenosidimutans TaxID=1176537 RepID=A0ABP9AW74_9SPHI